VAKGARRSLEDVLEASHVNEMIARFSNVRRMHDSQRLKKIARSYVLPWQRLQ